MSIGSTITIFLVPITNYRIHLIKLLWGSDAIIDGGVAGDLDYSFCYYYHFSNAYHQFTIKLVSFSSDASVNLLTEGNFSQ